jgi:hypothetical protein
VLIKDFSSFAQQLTDRIKQGAYELFRKAGRPVQYLSNNETSKEALAQELAQNNGLRQGALVLFACVEPCLSFHIRGDRQAKRIRLVLEHSKCTHLYHYYQHPEFGLMHVRVQTWFPFTVSVTTALFGWRTLWRLRNFWITNCEVTGPRYFKSC